MSQEIVADSAESLGYGREIFIRAMENLGPFGTGDLTFSKQNETWFLSLSAPTLPRKLWDERGEAKSISIAKNDNLEMKLFHTKSGRIFLRVFSFRGADMGLVEVSRDVLQRLTSSLRNQATLLPTVSQN